MDWFFKILIRKQVHEVIRKTKQKTTIILTTHSMEEAELLGDEFATMKNGKIEMEIDIDDWWIIFRYRIY